jgi:hypothetical protein
MLVVPKNPKDCNTLLKKDFFKADCALGKKVQVRLPKAQRVGDSCQVVIVGVDTDIEETDIIETLEQQQFPYSKVRRITSRERNCKTRMVRLFLDVEKCGSAEAAGRKRSDLLKSGIYLDHMKFKCVPAKEDTEKKLVNQCWNCQVWNQHKTADCPNPIKCVICGESHRKKDCEKTKEESKCSNCDGSHAAWSTICPAYKQALEHKKPSYAKATAEQVLTPSALSTIILNLKKQIAAIIAEVVTKALLDHIFYEQESKKSNGQKIFGTSARATSIAKVATQAVNRRPLMDGDATEVSHDDVQTQVLDSLSINRTATPNASQPTHS